MKTRIEPARAAPEAYKAMRALNAYVEDCGLAHDLLELVKVRASQINGCAFCIDMHAKAARRHGVAEQKLYVLLAWRESPLFAARERAALAWTEALTRVAEAGAPEEAYQELLRHFTPAEAVNLTVAIGLINAWNRIAIGFAFVHPVEPPVAAAAG